MQDAFNSGAGLRPSNSQAGADALAHAFAIGQKSATRHGVASMNIAATISDHAASAMIVTDTFGY
jgi:hypothetical protein